MLNCDVPAILGLEWLRLVNPVIDWKLCSMRVPVGSRKVSIQVKRFSRRSSVKTVVADMSSPRVRCADVAG